MSRFHVLGLAVLIAVPLTTGVAAAAGTGSAWTSDVSFTNVVASSATTGGGYPVPPGRGSRGRDLSARVRSTRTTPSRGWRSSPAPRT